VCDQHGKKALMIASSEGHLPVVEYLCERGGAVESLVVGPGLVIKWQAASSSKVCMVFYCQWEGGQWSPGGCDGWWYWSEVT